MEILKVNASYIRPCICKSRGLRFKTTCTYCNSKLSSFSLINLYNSDDSIMLRGRICNTCDVVYVSDNIPTEVDTDMQSKFKGSILVINERINHEKFSR